MGTLKIRNFDDALKSRLQRRAAARNRSMSEEARHILRAALPESSVPVQDLGAKIRARFTGLDDVELALELRQADALAAIAGTFIPRLSHTGHR